jgi:hypothetical protein
MQWEWRSEASIECTSGTEMGRDDRTGKVACCAVTEEPLPTLAGDERPLPPLIDHCLKPSTDEEWEKSESWRGS